jgi:DNA polymerase I-like protein with 3'-5' exonuclease and polymerase domains
MIAIDTETNGLFIHKGCQAFMVTACTDKGKVYLWQFEINPYTREVSYKPSIVEDIITTIKEHGTLVFHNANFDIQVLNSMGISLEFLYSNFVIHDTMIMSHAYKSSDRHGLKDLSLQYCDIPDTDESDLHKAVLAARRIGKKKGYCIADENDPHPTLIGIQKEHSKCDFWLPGYIAKADNYPFTHPWHTVCSHYAKLDAERTMALYLFFDHRMREIPNETKYTPPSKYLPKPTGTLYDKYVEAAALILPMIAMQQTQIPIIPSAVDSSLDEFQQRNNRTLRKLRTLSRKPDFNPRSHPQLGEILFKRFKFKQVKGTSTDKDVITKLLSEMPTTTPIPPRYEFLLTLKEYRKEITTIQYLTNYKIHAINGKVQASYGQTKTGTGRLAATDPNITNVGKKDMSNPFADDKDKARAAIFSEILGIDTDHKFSLRKVFGPQEGEQWTCIDYDQFQLRIFAVVSESYELIEGFERGDDIHRVVAKTIFQKDDISDVERTAAKAINFGLLFGAGPEKIELLAGVPGLYSMFMANFPKAKKYLDAQSRLARTKGYVHTVGGYRLYVPREAPHAASCYVIQGTEAEIVKTAMVRCYDYYASLSRPVYRLMMMIHDELVFTSKRTNKLELAKIMSIMESSGTDIGIPTKVDYKITKTTWADKA